MSKPEDAPRLQEHAERFAPEVSRPLSAWEQRVREMSDEDHKMSASELAANIRQYELDLRALLERQKVLDAEMVFREIGGGAENVAKWRARSILRAVQATHGSR